MKGPLTKLFLKTIGRLIPSDIFAYRMPVSVKGICFIDGKVILLKNERNEWDLPGGKLGRGEKVEEALVREMKEELGIEIAIVKLIGVRTARIQGKIDVLIILYLCETKALYQDLRLSQESFGLELFDPRDLPDHKHLPLYHQQITKVYWDQRQAGEATQ